MTLPRGMLGFLLLSLAPGALEACGGAHVKGPARPVPAPIVGAAVTEDRAAPHDARATGREADEEGRVDRVVDAILTDDIVVLDEDRLARLSPAERDELARRAEAILADPPPMLPRRRVLVTLTRAWSPRAEVIVARYVVAEDPTLRSAAIDGLRARGLSRMALVRSPLPGDASPEVLAAAATAIARADDVDADAVAALCARIPANAATEDDLWTCEAAATRAGDARARASLARRITRLAVGPTVQQAETRLGWLVEQVGDRGPWAELASQVDNPARAPPVHCIEHEFCGTCQLQRARPRYPIGDAFVRAIARANRLELTFGTDAPGTFTPAQRAEVKRKLAALASKSAR